MNKEEALLSLSTAGPGDMGICETEILWIWDLRQAEGLRQIAREEKSEATLAPLSVLSPLPQMLPGWEGGRLVSVWSQQEAPLCGKAAPAASLSPLRDVGAQEQLLGP